MNATDILAQPEPDFDPEAYRLATMLLSILSGVDTPAIRHNIAYRIVCEAHITGMNRVQSAVLDLFVRQRSDRRQVKAMDIFYEDERRRQR